MASYLEERLKKRVRQGNIRTLTLPKELEDFSSNDYLGLARSPKLREAFDRTWKGEMGATGSRLLTGNGKKAEQLEAAIAAFHGYEAGLLFGCGFLANMGLFSAIGGWGDLFIFDSAIHASARLGMRLSPAKALPFRHNDLDHLEGRLKRSGAAGQRYICVESLYSTDGTLAPLKELCCLAERYGAKLIVDEAHAVGVLGPRGAGLVAEMGLAQRVFALLVTFGKALGTYGAILLTDRFTRRALVNFSFPFIYTTALPGYVLAAIECSYSLFPSMEREREQLKLLAAEAAAAGPICAIPTPGPHAAIAISQALAKRGFDLKPLLSPTVKRGEECLRLTLHAFNTQESLRQLIKELKNG